MADEIAPRPAIGRAGWLVVALLIVVQFGLFRQFVAREVAPMVPRGYDQTTYLSFAYDLHEQALEQGAERLPRLAVALRCPAGLAMHLQAASLMLVLGPSRLTALLPHFVYFAAFQCLLVALVLRWTRRWDVAFFALGLLLTATSPHQLLGGLFDFRIDGLAFSLYGALLGLVVASDGFSSRRWSLAVAAAGVALVSFRYLTVVYLAGVMALWLLATAARLPWTRDAAARAMLWRRVLNALLVCVVVGVAAAVILLPQRKALWAYYGVGHLVGAEKEVRAAEAGVAGATDALLYYARSVWTDHAGWRFFAVGVVGLLAAVWLRLSRRATGGPRFAYALMALGLAVPWLVLTANTAKSPVVGNLLVPPLLWLLVLPLVRAAPAGRSVVLGVVAVVALAVGVGTQAGGYCRHERLLQTDRADLMALHDDLTQHALAQGWTAPLVCPDDFTDVLPPFVMGVPAYERQGVKLNLRAGAAGSLLVTDDDAVRRDVRRSEFVLLSGGGFCCPAYPAAQTLARLRPWMREHCEREMERIGTYRVHGHELKLYAKPSVRVTGSDPTWVTSAGLLIKGTARTLRRFPHVRLRGRVEPNYLTAMPNVRVRLGEDGATVPARIVFPTPDSYVIDVDLSGQTLPDGPVEMRLTFDRFFVPRQRGINDDARELVVYSPEEIALHRRGDSGITGDPDKPRKADSE